MGFEPTRGDPIGLAGRRLSHSAKVSLAIRAPHDICSDSALDVIFLHQTNVSSTCFTMLYQPSTGVYSLLKSQSAFFIEAANVRSSLRMPLLAGKCNRPTAAPFQTLLHSKPQSHAPKPRQGGGGTQGGSAQRSKAEHKQKNARCEKVSP